MKTMLGLALLAGGFVCLEKLSAAETGRGLSVCPSSEQQKLECVGGKETRAMIKFFFLWKSLSCICVWLPRPCSGVLRGEKGCFSSNSAKAEGQVNATVPGCCVAQDLTGRGGLRFI